MINMDKQEFERKVKENKVFSVTDIIPGDEVTPINIFFNLSGVNKFLLESAFFKESKGRYSYIGADPYMKIQSKRSVVSVKYADGRFETAEGDVLKVLKRHVQIGVEGCMGDMPFTGGAVGYLGYDAVRNYENIPDNNEEEIQVPDSCFNLYKTIICYDHFKQLITINYQVFKEEQLSFEEIVQQLNDIKLSIKSSRSPHNLEESKKTAQLVGNTTKDDYVKAVEAAKDYIKKGDIFQVVISQRFHAEIDEHPFQIYRRLRSLNPSPYLFFIEFDGFTAAGASPESLVKVTGRRVETNPIAGTRPRGVNRQQDEVLKNDMMKDEKEKAEHLMLVDLGRNDMGKVSKFGTVSVERFMEVDYYSHVMHMVSTVAGELKDHLDCFDALRACFPAGTVSGAPKIRAMEIIDELEKVRRGIYAGAVGYFSFDGDMDTCIAIRTIVFKNNKAYLQAGAGIVYDSHSEKEYEETLNKLGAIREVI